MEVDFWMNAFRKELGIAVPLLQLCFNAQKERVNVYISEGLLRCSAKKTSNQCNVLSVFALVQTSRHFYFDHAYYVFMPYVDFEMILCQMVL